MIERIEDLRRPIGCDLTNEQLLAVANQIAARADLWSELVRHDPDQRTYEHLLHDEHLDVWLNCWSRDHDTGFHDHDLSAGAVAVIAGSEREERLVLGRPLTLRSSAPPALAPRLTLARARSTECFTRAPSPP